MLNFNIHWIYVLEQLWSYLPSLLRLLKKQFGSTSKLGNFSVEYKNEIQEPDRGDRFYTAGMD